MRYVTALSAPVKKSKRQRKIPEGRVIIGKNVPIHWGESEIVEWEVHDEKMGRIEGYKTRKEACIMFPYLKQTGTVMNPSKICPLLKFEGAIMNPYKVDWDNCFVPTEEDTKIPNNMVWAVKVWSQENHRDLMVGHLLSKENDPFKLRELANKDQKIIAKADKLNLMKSEQPRLKYWFTFELEDWEE